MVEVFERGGHKIFWGDALEVLSTEVQDNSVDLIFADPRIISAKTLMVDETNGSLMTSIWNGAIGGSTCACKNSTAMEVFT